MQSKRLVYKLCKKVFMFLLPIVILVGSVQGQHGWYAIQHKQTEKDFNAVYFIDSKRGWVAGDNGLVLYTKDAGFTWTQQRTGTSESINDIYFQSKENGYLLAANRIFYTNDGGEEWREIRRFMPEDFDGAMPELYSVRFAHRKRGWIVGSISRKDTVVDSLVLYTNDGGTTWERQRIPIKTELINLDFISDDRGWIVGAAGVILHTRDGGKTWVQQRSGTDATLYHVDFRDKKIGWAVGERGTILHTTDGGEVWRAIPVSSKATFLSVKFINDEQGWIAGHGGTIMRSGDGGQTWIQQESKTQQNIYALFISKDNGWAVGGNGVVLQYDL
jgi:photosystem II stability/assembly factor-like uncharacterized protein